MDLAGQTGKWTKLPPLPLTASGKGDNHRQFSCVKQHLNPKNTQTHTHTPLHCFCTHSGLWPSVIFSLHLGQSGVGVLQELLDVLSVLLLHFKLLLLHRCYGRMQLKDHTITQITHRSHIFLAAFSRLPRFISFLIPWEMNVRMLIQGEWTPFVWLR